MMEEAASPAKRTTDTGRRTTTVSDKLQASLSAKSVGFQLLNCITVFVPAEMESE